MKYFLLMFPFAEVVAQCMHIFVSDFKSHINASRTLWKEEDDPSDFILTPWN